MRIGTLFCAVTFIVLAAGKPAAAIPVFAHRYGFSCQACHTAIPHLNAYGLAFRNNGYRIPGSSPAGAFPIAAKVNLAYSSTADPSGLPKAMVDELELLTGGHTGKNVSYFIEQYVIDGGRPGSTRDAWVQFNNALTVKLGEFTLPLPVDPETERDTLAHYAAFDQTVANNPFNFFNQHIGADLSIGSPFSASAHALVLSGHDPQSGLTARGLDLMAYAQANLGGILLSAYRYKGQRPLGPIVDGFSRQAFGAVSRRGKLELDGLVQRGWDGSADGNGTSVASSAGFAQVRWEFSPALLAVARYDGTRDDFSGMRRSLAASLITRPARNMRFTLEGDFAHGSASVSSALLFAY